MADVLGMAVLTSKIRVGLVLPLVIAMIVLVLCRAPGERVRLSIRKRREVRAHVRTRPRLHGQRPDALDVVLFRVGTQRRRDRVRYPVWFDRTHRSALCRCRSDAAFETVPSSARPDLARRERLPSFTSEGRPFVAFLLRALGYPHADVGVSSVRMATKQYALERT